MRKMKYIVVDDGLSDNPYIFPDHIQHFYMLSVVGGKIISAGFVRFTPEELECYGESLSLGIKSRPICDTQLIKSLIGGKDFTSESEVNDD